MKMLCARKRCSNYSADGCSLWTDCPLFRAGKAQKRPSKYRAQKVSVCGMEFDSKKEAHRWFVLRGKEQAGEIQALRRQVEFVLIPAQKIRGRKGGERPISYIADFVYERDGKTVVEDVKGYKRGGAYAVFVMKRKLMLYIHGIVVSEV